MRIAIVYNARPENLDRKDPLLESQIEGDERKTILAIKRALVKVGHTCILITVDKQLYQKLARKQSSIDLILNLSEGIFGTADREAQLPMIAEMLGIPHTGPSPLSAALILNKERAKQIWRAAGVTTASSQLMSSPSDALSPSLHFPLIVKPNGEGSGIGIHNNSIVKNQAELKSAVKELIDSVGGSALVETYLPGREFTVAIVGNGIDLTVLPIIEINFAAFPHGSPAIDSYEAKFVYGATGEAPMHETEFCPAQIPKSLETKIIDLAKAAYLAIGCQDFGRLDIRCDSDDNPYVLEINHPPGLMSDPEESSFFTISTRAAGWDFNRTIKEIISAATKRLGLTPYPSTSTTNPPVAI